MADFSFIPVSTEFLTCLHLLNGPVSVSRDCVALVVLFIEKITWYFRFVPSEKDVRTVKTMKDIK